MSAKHLEFFFDFASPYSYIASHQIEAVAEKPGTELVWQPFVLGGVFQAMESLVRNCRRGMSCRWVQDNAAINVFSDISCILFTDGRSRMCYVHLPDGGCRRL